MSWYSPELTTGRVCTAGFSTKVGAPFELFHGKENSWIHDMAANLTDLTQGAVKGMDLPGTDGCFRPMLLIDGVACWMYSVNSKCFSSKEL